MGEGCAMQKRALGGAPEEGSDRDYEKEIRTRCLKHLELRKMRQSIEATYRDEPHSTVRD
jgi:hypothetical protein